MPRPRGLLHSIENDTEVSDGGCLLWKWATVKAKGAQFGGQGGLYGKLRLAGKYLYAHRFYFEQFNGRIPFGFVVHHTCYNTLCCNPDHLETLTQGDNVRDWRRRYYGDA